MSNPANLAFRPIRRGNKKNADRDALFHNLVAIRAAPGEPLLL